MVPVEMRKEKVDRVRRIAPSDDLPTQPADAAARIEDQHFVRHALLHNLHTGGVPANAQMRCGSRGDGSTHAMKAQSKR